MISPVVRLHGVPVFYPLTETGTPDLDWISRNCNGARAMLAAHFFGFVNSLAETRLFCDARKIGLIEDCAHAFFGRAGEHPVGSLGDVAIASLTKFFPVPEGGCLVSNQRVLGSLALTPRPLLDELHTVFDAVEYGARYGRFPGLNGFLRTLFGTKEVLRGRTFTPVAEDDSDRVRPPHASEISEDRLFHAPTRATRRIALAAHRGRIVTLRRRNYTLLAQLLAGLPGAEAYRSDLGDDVVPYVFPLDVENPQARYRALRAARVPLFRWDRVWPGTPSIPGDHGTRWATRMFQFACHQDLREHDVRSIAATVRQVFTELR
jgi:dTDP-4-amino-4,6-dideoxygalactose transaminase